MIISAVDEGENEICEDTVFEIFKSIDGNFKKVDIANCKRISNKKNENGTTNHDRPRLILATLRYEQDALYFHNSGYGRKYGDNCWINPDLTKAERDARYKLRCDRRAKYAKEAAGASASTPEEDVLPESIATAKK